MATDDKKGTSLMTTTPGDKQNPSQLPPHWKFGGDKHPTFASWNPILCIHQLLCIISFGCASLETVWDKCHSLDSIPPDLSNWQNFKKSGQKRLQHINLVAALLLATVTIFCTTEPPADGRILPYTNPIPYCFMLASMGVSLSAIILGSCIVFLGLVMSPGWFLEVGMGSKRRIWVTMFIWSLPFFLTLTTIWALAIGLTIAATSSEFVFLRFIWIIPAFPPVASILVLLWFAFIKPGALMRVLGLGSSENPNEQQQAGEEGLEEVGIDRGR